MLAQRGIQVEALGGDIQSINISALRGTNVDTLTEAIALQAEIVGLKGDPTGLVEAVVIECSTDRYRGKLATALIQRGTLRKGSLLGKDKATLYFFKRARYREYIGKEHQLRFAFSLKEMLSLMKIS